MGKGRQVRKQSVKDPEKDGQRASKEETDILKAKSIESKHCVEQ